MNQEIISEEIAKEPDILELQKKKKIKYVIITCATCLILGIGVSYFNKSYIYTNTMANNVIIEDINVSGMTKKEVTHKLLEKYTPKALNLNYDSQEFKINPNEINLRYNLDDVVKNAFNYTKTDSYFQNLSRVLKLVGSEKAFDIKASYDKDLLNSRLEEISKDVNQDVTDAKVSISSSGNINVEPAKVGLSVDIEKNKESIYKMIDNKSLDKFNLLVSKTEPKVSTKVAGTVDTLLSQYTTKYSTGDWGRTTNIAISAKRTSDVLLMPGEEFSYNDLTGPRTKSNGYQDANVIVNGEIEKGPGGGVCQTSTTMYNAVLYSGLDITDTQNHSISSKYVPLGRDAMVNEGGSDFKFVNQYDHPVYIKNIISKGKITTKIYGSSSDKKNIDIRVDRLSSKSTKTYRQYKDTDGKLIDTEFVAQSSYKKLG